jgi:hypothetical protein
LIKLIDYFKCALFIITVIMIIITNTTIAARPEMAILVEGITAVKEANALS